MPKNNEGNKRYMYSLSKYNYVIKNENKRIVYNLYTQALIELKSDEYKKLMELDKQSPYRDNYIELGFWVDYDETDEILRINQQNINCDTTLYMTLRMTDACNFRCPYCYQGHENSRLDSEKIEIIKRMLAKKIPGCEDVYIHYFGGEPLLNLEGILDIDQFIKSFKQDYIASMTTNGFLLSEEALEKIKYTNIKKIQITLDGPARIHNKTRILANGKGPFDTLIKNIQNALIMTDADIIIRFNCGKKNKEYAKELLEILWERKILKSDRVNMLFQQLHNYNGIDDKETYYDNKEYFSILAELIRLLISYGKKIYRFGPIYNACQLYLNNSYVISPDLEIESCTSNEKSIGKISQNGDIIYNDNYKYKSQYMIPDEKCKECRLLPLCMGGCPYKRSKNLNSCLTDLEGIEKYILACKEGIENGCEMA